MAGDYSHAFMSNFKTCEHVKRPSSVCRVINIVNSHWIGARFGYFQLRAIYIYSFFVCVFCSFITVP